LVVPPPTSERLYPGVGLTGIFADEPVFGESPSIDTEDMDERKDTSPKRLVSPMGVVGEEARRCPSSASVLACPTDDTGIRDNVRVGERERDAPSDGLATPNSIGTPSGIPELPFRPFEWPFPLPLSVGELVRREGVTRTGSGIKESVPAVIADSLSKDEVRRALFVVGVVGAEESIGIGMDDGDVMPGEKVRCCWGVPAPRESFSRAEARSSLFLERPTESTLPVGLGARYDERDEGRDTALGTATDGIPPREQRTKNEWMVSVRKLDACAVH